MEKHVFKLNKEYENHILYYCANKKIHNCKSTRKMIKSNGELVETGHSRGCKWACGAYQDVFKIPFSEFEVVKDKNFSEFDKPDVEMDTTVENTEMLSDNYSTHAVSEFSHNDSEFDFDWKGRIRSKIQLKLNLALINMINTINKIISFRCKPLFYSKVKEEKLNFMKLMPQLIRCCGRVFKRKNYRRHLDYCRQLSEKNKEYCDKCLRKCAKPCEFLIEGNIYFLKAHKCYKQPLKRINTKRKRYVRLSRINNKSGMPLKKQMQIIIGSVYNRVDYEFSLFELAEILHTENNLRNSKLFKHQSRILLFTGNYSGLIDADYALAKLALKLNNYSNSYSWVQQYFYKCHVYRSYLCDSIRHFTTKFKFVRDQKLVKEDVIKQFKLLNPCTKYDEESYFAFLRATGQHNKVIDIKNSRNLFHFVKKINKTI